MIKHNGPISGIAASRASVVATAGYDNQVILWDATSGVATTRVLHDHLANQVVFAPDGSTVLTASSDYTARLWQLPDLKLVAVYADQTDDVEMAAFSPDGTKVATASRDHRARIYDKRGPLLTTLEGHTADVISVAWSEDGSSLLSSSDDGTIKRWSVDSGRLIESYDMDGVETDTIAIGPDGTIYAGDDSGDVVIILGGEHVRIPAHKSGVKRIVLNADTGALVSLSYDRQLKVWRRDGQGGLELVSTAQLPEIVWPRSCAFLSSDTLVFATFGSTYATFNISSGTWNVDGVDDTRGINASCVRQGELFAVGDAGVVLRNGTVHARMGSLCNFLTPVGDRLLTGGQMGAIFDADTGELLYQHHSPFNCGVELPSTGDTARVAFGAYTGEVVVLVRQGEAWQLETQVKMHANAIKGLACDGSEVFGVCADNTVAWCSADTLKVIDRNAGHDKIVNGCATVEPGHFASVSRDLTLRLWHPDRTHTTISTPHDHSIKCVAASACGRYVATGSYNGMVAIYDRRGCEWSPVSRPTSSGVSSLHFDASRDLFLASSYDGHVYDVLLPGQESSPV